MTSSNIVFLSYARENSDIAERLYMSLREKEINVWLDSKCLKPGVNWKLEINNVIKNARYYILLISKHSINKRGFVQKEIREALDILQEFPRNQIFIIPVRIDNTAPIDDELLDLNWVDLYLDYHKGLEKILRSLTDLIPESLMLNISSNNKDMKVLEIQKKIIHKGQEMDYAQPVMIGEKRGAISYAPFRTMEDYFMQFIDRMPPQSIYADSSISYYFTIITQHPDLILGDDLLLQYPEGIILVFQNLYADIKAFSSFFTVTLSFNKENRTVKIPYASILKIEVPELGLSITRKMPKPLNEL
ncbi:MAG: TIR domain-containing protein [Nostocales cyanobacterium W4_Combined_metabat2_030]|nr:TIR domain-containing protein [Nostocales cyanobacterium W4_Combined_metabat2_030]